MLRHRTLACAVLIAALCLQALALGAAAVRAEAFDGPRHEVVICGADGPRPVILDAQGNPAAPERNCLKTLCPDCVAATAFALAPAALPLPAPARHATAMQRPGHFAPITRFPPAPPARAPPSEA